MPTISLILLTHATVPHLAAYAHCCKHFPLFARIPVYATFPVISLGRTLIQDLYASTPAAATTIPPSALAEAGYTSVSPTSSSSDPRFLLQPPTADEISLYFAQIHPLKYSQPHQPVGAPWAPPLGGLTVTAYNAGHTLGGTIWLVTSGLESVVYAVGWHQGRENVLAGAAWLGSGAGAGEIIEPLRRPSALVCGAAGSQQAAGAAAGGGGGSRVRRDEQLLATIRECVRRGGTVLIPADSGARVLELAYLLEHAWRADAIAASTDAGGRGNRRERERDADRDTEGVGVLAKSKLYLAGRHMGAAMRYARSMLEWMDDNVVREFEAVADGSRRVASGQNGAGQGGSTDGGRPGGPFDFRFMRVLEKKAQVDKILSRQVETGEVGRVIVASDSSIEWGFSKDVLRAIARDSRNMVILTEKPNLANGMPSLARTLWTWWKERRDGASVDGGGLEHVYSGGRELKITTSTREPLDGSDLEAYQRWLATQRQLQATLQGAGGTSLEAPLDAADDASSESSSESEQSEGEQQGKALNVSMTQANRRKVVLRDEDLGVNILLKKRGVYDFDVRGKKGRERMFPMPIRRRRWDDFGEVIRPEDFLRAEEKEEADGLDAEHPDSRKRKWDDMSEKLKAIVGGKADSKRPRPDRNLSVDDMDTLFSVAGPTALQDPELDELEDDADASAAADAAAGPSRLVQATETVVANLKIAYVDFSGLHDRRSLHMLIPLIAPRKLIFVGGARDETLAIADYCKKLLQPDASSQAAGTGTGAPEVIVYAPATGDAVNASVDTNAWSVRLTDALVKRLKWQNVRGLGIVTLSGQLVGRPAADGDSALPTVSSASKKAPTVPPTKAEEDEDAANKRQKTDGGTDVSTSTAVIKTEADSTSAEPSTTEVRVVPTLDVLAPSTAFPLLHHGAADASGTVARVSSLASASSRQQPLHVGELRLADLRRGLQARGHAAEFRGEGALLVDGCVIVRKVMGSGGGGRLGSGGDAGSGRVEIESVGFDGISGGGPGGQMGPGRGAAGAGDDAGLGMRGTFYAVRKVIYDGLAVVAGG